MTASFCHPELVSGSLQCEKLVFNAGKIPKYPKGHPPLYCSFLANKRSCKFGMTAHLFVTLNLVQGRQNVKFTLTAARFWLIYPNLAIPKLVRNDVFSCCSAGLEQLFFSKSLLLMLFALLFFNIRSENEVFLPVFGFFNKEIRTFFKTHIFMLFF